MHGQNHIKCVSLLLTTGGYIRRGGHVAEPFTSSTYDIKFDAHHIGMNLHTKM